MITKMCPKCKGSGEFIINKKHTPCINCHALGIIKAHETNKKEITNNVISLWSEGYSATGDYSDATYHGNFNAINLRDAVKQFKNSLTDESSKKLIDLNKLTFWGCKFFDNEHDARKNFG